MAEGGLEFYPLNAPPLEITWDDSFAAKTNAESGEELP